MNHTPSEKSQLIDLVKDKSLRFGDFTLSSGARSSYYIDCRKTTMSARGLRLIGSIGLDIIRTSEWTPRAVGGLTLGADPVSYAIAVATNDAPPVIDAFTVRKQAKQHGMRAAIEGCLPTAGSVVVVEDVITTGASALRAIEAVESVGLKVDGVISVVDRDAGGREKVEAMGFQCISMVTLGDLGVSRP